MIKRDGILPILMFSLAEKVGNILKIWNSLCVPRAVYSTQVIEITSDTIMVTVISEIN
jgi:hypothetical protein